MQITKKEKRGEKKKVDKKREDWERAKREWVAEWTDIGVGGGGV